MSRAARFSTTSRRILLALGLAGGVGACSDAPVPVQIQVTLDGEPVAGLEVVALPYDPTRMLDSLAAATGARRPDFGDLEGVLLAFVRPAPSGEDGSDREVRATRDSAAALADSLRRSDRRDPGYPAAYRRFRQLYARLVQRSAAHQTTRRGELDSLRALALRAGRAADSLRAWEQAAYAGFDSAALAAENRTGRRPVGGVTDHDGWVTLALAPGAWWLDAELDHAENPFAEYHWEVPMVVAGLPFRLPVTEETARIAWRH